MKKNQSVAYCPAAVSFLFRPHLSSDPLKTGSTGIGCTLDKGVVACVQSKERESISFNGVPVSIPSVRDIMHRIAPEEYGLSVDFTSSVPLGYGFGMSGACAVSAAFAARQYSRRDWTDEELIRLAHCQEIQHHTGLGTVGTQATGGCLVKTSPGLPVQAWRLPFTGQELFATILGSRETSGVLQNKRTMDDIISVADRLMKRLQPTKRYELSDILDLSYKYVSACGFLDKETEQIIRKIQNTGGHATLALIGQVVLSDTVPDGEKKYRVEKYRITQETVRTGK